LLNYRSFFSSNGRTTCPQVMGNTLARPRKDLTDLHVRCILIHMRTTLNIEESLLKQAAELTGLKEKTALVRRGLEALIALESARRLAALGGSEKKLKPIPRRRTSAA
jgi:hypothetical protein